ncbi:hypothetical protein [Rubritalea tangerina]|uniref:hypothetical protein n=1 Tax=Rubritalea tangerina TaxID=430798 RepID=UPI0036085E2C
MPFLSDLDHTDEIEITSGNTNLSIDRIGNVFISTDSQGKPLNLIVMLEPTEAKKLEVFTSSHIGELSEIKLNGEVISSARFSGVISKALGVPLSTGLTSEQVSSLKRMSEKQVIISIDPNLKSDGKKPTMAESIDKIFSQD